MKILAVDLGDHRTGVALSDPTGFLTGEAFVIPEYNRDKLAAEIARIAKDRGAARIVLGHPKNMNATLGERSDKAALFADKLRALWDGPVLLWDERQTSVSANRILSDAGKKRQKQRERVDAVAASLILESYLDYLRLHPDGVS